MNTIPFTLSLSLFDSLSTTVQIIIFALLLSTTKPIRNSISFLAGLSGAYFFCGFVGYLGFNQLNVFLKEYFPSGANLSNDNYYLTELVSGILMLIFGIWYFRKKRHAPADFTQNLLVSRLHSMNTSVAAGIGAFISITSFPVSIPYIIALGKYSTLQLKLPAAIGNILLYNFGYALPMLVILTIYFIARKKAYNLTDTLHEKTRVLNVQLTTWTLVVVGIFSMIDAGCYFSIGHAIIKGRYF